jgi:hypothetical protein
MYLPLQSVYRVILPHYILAEAAYLALLCLLVPGVALFTGVQAQNHVVTASVHSR